MSEENTDQELEALRKAAGITKNELDEALKELNGLEKLVGTFGMYLAKSSGVHPEIINAWIIEVKNAGSKNLFPATEKLAAAIAMKLKQQ